MNPDTNETKISVPLDNVAVGSSCTVRAIDCADPTLRNLLLSMGLVSGAGLHVTQSAPFDGPLGIDLKGFRLSLRGSEAENVRVALESKR